MRILIMLFIGGIILALSVFIVYEKTPNKTLAVTDVGCPTSSPSPNFRSLGGLVSSPQITGTFNNDAGKCLINPDAEIKKFPITYTSLRSTYFDKATDGANFTKQPSIVGNASSSMLVISPQDKIIHITGNLTLDNSVNPVSNKTGVVFVDGNLTIKKDVNYSGPNQGLVFIVQNDIYISADVNVIDAVLISEGNIYTASDLNGILTCNESKVLLNSTGDIQQLLVNGSLIDISQDSNEGIRFCRNLGAVKNADTPSERVNYEAKYLILLRDMLPYNKPIWSEIP
jgi:hypothetical protein